MDYQQVMAQLQMAYSRQSAAAVFTTIEPFIVHGIHPNMQRIWPRFAAANSSARCFEKHDPFLKHFLELSSSLCNDRFTKIEPVLLHVGMNIVLLALFLDVCHTACRSCI